MPVNMTALKSNILPFLNYRSSVGYAREATVKSNAVDLNLFVRFMDDNGKDAIRGRDVIAFQQHLAGKRHDTPASINRKIFTLRSRQNFLDLKGLEGAVDLPFKKVLKIRAPRPYRANFLNEDEIKTLFNSINTGAILGLRDYAVFALMFLLGLRVGEVHRLNLQDINWQNNTILITGKCNIERTLTLSNEMRSALENYLLVRNHLFLAENNEALFISKKGNRIAIRTIQDNFKKLTEAAQIDRRFRVTPHTLRHTCATFLNEKDVKILTIQNILGHTNPNTTINYYLHTTENSMREALQKLPLTLFLNELIESGKICFSFQNDRYGLTG